jgi:DNA-binding NarL/FixJ family response regulator
LTILCVDDHSLVGDALVKLLTRVGDVVDRIDHEEAAWTRLSTDLHGFDVVIADHKTPHLSGLALAGRLRDARFSGRIIVYSGDLNEADVENYQRLMVDSIVNKGPDSERLLAVLQAVHTEIENSDEPSLPAHLRDGGGC